MKLKIGKFVSAFVVSIPQKTCNLVNIYNVRSRKNHKSSAATKTPHCEDNCTDRYLFAEPFLNKFLITIFFCSDSFTHVN